MTKRSASTMMLAYEKETVMKEEEAKDDTLQLHQNSVASQMATSLAIHLIYTWGLMDIFKVGYCIDMNQLIDLFEKNKQCNYNLLDVGAYIKYNQKSLAHSLVDV